MAFTASAVIEVQTGGDDTNNGGIFDTGVAGFPTDGATTLATSNSPVFTSASYNFVAGDVGAWVYIKSGTNWTAGWYRIASVAANAATLSAAIGAAVLSNGSLSTVAGCATTASPTGATWGIDYSQQAGAQITFTDMVIGATTTQFTSVLNPVGKNFVGNSISVTSGTGFTVQRVVVASTSGTTATCDKSLGTAASVAGNGRLGGALASPGLAGSLLTVSGMACYVNTGTYTLSSGSANVSGGTILVSTNIFVTVEGYGTLRGDLLSPPTFINAAFTAISMVSQTSGRFCISNFIVDGNSKTSVAGCNLNSASGIAYLVTARNCTNGGFTNGGAIGRTMCIRCIAMGCSTIAAFNTCTCFLCEAYSNTVTGFTNSQASFCLSYNNSGGSSLGFGTSNTIIVNCVAYGNGSNGFTIGSTNSAAINCHAEGNTGVGFGGSNNAGALAFLLNCSAYNNTGGATSNTVRAIPALLTPSVSAFVNAASNNFALNSAAGAGALLRAAGIPGAYPVAATTGYQDIGAAQHQDANIFVQTFNVQMRDAIGVSSY